MRIRIAEIPRIEALRVLDPSVPLTIQTIKRWRATAVRITEKYGVDFNPIVERIEHELVTPRGTKKKPVHKRRLQRPASQV